MTTFNEKGEDIEDILMLQLSVLKKCCKDFHDREYEY